MKWDQRTPLRAERVLLLCCVLVLVSNCLPSFELPDESLGMCGAEGQACCGRSETPCGARLECEQVSDTCRRPEQRYCVADRQCRAGQTCCPSGLLGSCVSLQGGSECPLADLQLTTTPETLLPWHETRFFDPVTAAGDACAIEKGCIRAAGLRELLHFTTFVKNAGAADLLLGTPKAAPFVTAVCDQQPYLPNFLAYQLVNVDGDVVAEGHMQAQCTSLPDPFVSTIDCEFYGLSSGFSQLFPVQTANFEGGPTTPGLDPTLCQWLDVTDVAPGNYVLRMQVDPGGMLVEEHTDNNQLDLPILIPAFNAPGQPCPDGDDYELLGTQLERECGWSASAPLTACTPGEPITVACPDCSADPMLRVCAGAAPCSSKSALASGDSSYRACDGGSALLSGADCEVECCGEESQCPVVRFACPASGMYAVYAASSDRSRPDCAATVQPSSPGSNAVP